MIVWHIIVGIRAIVFKSILRLFFGGKVISRASVLTAVLGFSSLFPVCAHAKSLEEFQAMSPDEQGKYLADYVLKMKTDIAAKNPEMANDLWAYFTHAAPGKPISQGDEDLLVQELAVDRLAKQGKADKSKIQVEGMIVYVVKQHFQPQPSQQAQK